MMHTLTSIWRFYRDGFREMTIGRTLWALILVKLFIIFLILKLFFFPDILSQRAADTTDGDKGAYVAEQLIP